MSEQYKLTNEQWDALRESHPNRSHLGYVRIGGRSLNRADVDQAITALHDVLGMVVPSREPLTDEEWNGIEGVHSGHGRDAQYVEVPSGWTMSRGRVNALRAAGWTVQPPKRTPEPEPRYYVKASYHPGSPMTWMVRERTGPRDNDWRWVATFTSEVDARAYCDAKNEEDR
jgi:hypothetical protein